MKKMYSFLAVALATLSMNAQDLAFAGGDFEDFSAFENGIFGTYSLLNIASQGSGEGIDGSNSLSIDGTQSKNKYVFTVVPPTNLPNDVTAITFMIKGTSPSRSISLNLYKTGGSSFYVFNGGDITTDVTLASSGQNSYTGSIDTAGQWVKVTLDLGGATDYNTDATGKFLALKIGKNSNFAIDLDNFKVESSTLGTIDLDLVKSSSFVKNTIVKNELNFAVKAEVKVFDMNGKVLKNASVSETNPLNMTDVPQGMYIVTGVVDGKKVTEKIIKK